MFEVCDSRSACSIVAGPNVTINAVNISQDEFNIIILQMSSSIDRMEYENALKVALIAGISFKVILIDFTTLDVYDESSLIY